MRVVGFFKEKASANVSQSILFKTAHFSGVRERFDKPITIRSRRARVRRYHEKAHNTQTDLLFNLFTFMNSPQGRFYIRKLKICARV